MALTKELKKMLGKELTEQVEGKIGDSEVAIQKENMIPQSDFDKRLKGVQEQRDKFEEQFKKVSKDFKTLSGSTENIDDLKDTITKMKIDHETVLTDMKKENVKVKIDSKMNAKLTVAKVKSENARKAVKALIDMDKISLDGDNLLGFDEQLVVLQKSDAYFFDTEQQSGGIPPGAGSQVPGDRKYQKELDEARKNKDGVLASKLIMEAFKAGVSVY
jgi:hypothetical protein